MKRLIVLILLKIFSVAWGIAQWLRTLAALPKDPNLNPSPSGSPLLVIPGNEDPMPVGF